MNDLSVKKSEFSCSFDEMAQTLQHPSMFQVLLVNDDYTPMDFVIMVLTRFFYFGVKKATEIMLEVHYRGIGKCGLFTKDIAETKVYEVNQFSKSHEHPLLCVMKPLA